MQLKKEEEEKSNKVQLAKDKLQKISSPNKKHKEEPIDEKGRKKMHILPPTSIGTRVDSEKNENFGICASVT